MSQKKDVVSFLFINIRIVMFLLLGYFFIFPGTVGSQQSAPTAQPQANPRSELEEIMPPKGSDEITVSIMGPVLDDTENKLFRYLGGVRTDYMLQVANVDQVLPELAAVVKRTGKKIKYLVIAGHGDPTQSKDSAGFGIAGYLFGMNRIDFVTIEKEYQEKIALRKKKAGELCALLGDIERSQKEKSEDRDEKINKLLEKKSTLEKDILTLDQGNKNIWGIKPQHFLLSNIDEVYGVMAQDGIIVLLNCFSGMKEHMPFANTIGRVLFGEKSGLMAVSEEEIGAGEVPEWEPLGIPGVDPVMKKVSETFYQFVGLLMERHWRKPGEPFIWFNQKWLNIPPSQYLPIPPLLNIYFDPVCVMADYTSSVMLNAQVLAMKNSGKVSYTWSDPCSKVRDAKCQVDVEAGPGEVLEVNVNTKDEKGRTGEGTAYIVVKQPQFDIAITLSDPVPLFDATVKARASIVKGEKPKDSSWYWKSDGGLQLSDKYNEEIEVEVTDKGTLLLQLISIGLFGRTHILGETSITITPKDMKGLIDLQIEGPDKTEAEKEISLKAVTKAKDRSAEAMLKDIRIEWIMKNEVVNTGESFRFSATQEGSYTVAANAVKVIKSKKEILASASHTIAVSKKEETDDTGKLSFGGTASDIWEGGNTEDGFHLKRKKAETGPGSKDCQWTGYVGAEAWGKIDPSFAPKSQEEIASRLREEIEDHKKWGRKAEIRQFVIGDFKGEFVDTSVKFRSGGWAFDSGYRGCEVNAYGHGYIMKGYRVVELAYSVSGGGCFDNSHRPFLESQAATAQGEAKAILAGLQLIRNGSIKKEPYKGPKLDGSDLPKVIFVPAQIEKLKVGDVVKIQAVVENAKPEDSPFKYAWTGEFEGSGDTVRIKPAKPGKFTLSVSVDGAQYNLGSASVEYEVADYKVKVERLSPDNKPVPVGGKIRFKAVLTSEGKPATGNFIYRWQPHPEVTFSPFEDSSAETEALFTKPEKVNVWVQALEQKGEVLSTIAESDQLEIEVIHPKLKLSAEPKEPYVGKEVKVSAAEEPKMDENTIDFWWEISGDTLNPGPLKDNRQYTFRPKDTKPVTVTVHAKAKDGGADLGEENIIITAKPYQVTARIIEKFPKPRVFNPALKDFVDIPNGTFASDEQVTAEAEVAGGPLKDELRWNWTANEGTSISNPASSSPTLSRHEPGTAQAFVTAKDKDDVVLGSTAVSFPVTVSADQVKPPQTQEVKEKIKKAQEFASQGKLDEAIAVAEEAAKIDKDAAKPVIDQLAQESKNLGWRAVNERDFKAAVKRLEDAVRLNPADKDAKERLEKAKEFSSRWDNIIDREIPELDRLINGKKPFSAHKQLLRIQELQHDMPGGGSSDVLKGMNDRFYNAMEEYNTFSQEGSRKHTEYFKAIEWEKMLELAQEMTKRELSPADEKEVQSRIQFAQQQLNDQRQIMDFYSRMKADYERKTVPEPYKASKELREKTYAFRAEDQRKQQLLDLAAAIEKQEKIRSAMEYAKTYFRLGEEALRGYNYEGAVKHFTEGLKAIRDNGDMKDPDYAKYYKLYEEAIARDKRIRELWPGVSNAAMTEQTLTVENIEKALKDASEMLALQPNNTDIQIYKNRLDIKLRNIQDNKLKGEALWNEGKGLFDQNRHSDALTKFKESLKYLPTPEHITYVQELETTINKNRETSKKLRTEGEALQNQNRLEEAVSKYKGSLSYWPDSKLAEHIKLVEAKIAETNNKKQTADRLWQEGRTLYDQNKWSEALSKFKESITLWPDPVHQDYVQKMEAAKAAAKKLRDEGEAFQNQGKLQEAVSKYKESVKTWPNPALEDHIVKVGNEIKIIEEKKNCAKKNRDEGAALQQQNRLSEALAKYKASYACRPTSEMQEHIKKIETAIATPVQPDPNDIHYVKGFQGKWDSNWGALEFKVNGVKVEGNYTHDKGIIKATLTADKKTMEGQWLESPSYSPPGDGGKVTFTLSPDGNTITGKWGYGDNLNGGDWTGTRIKDVTTPVIVPEPPTPPEVGKYNLTGQWTASCSGKDRYEVRITHSGNSFEAKSDNDIYKGTINGKVINGRMVGQDNITLNGSIISDNEILVEHTSIFNNKEYKENCTLRR
jgi:hypothetical protein